MEDNLQKLQGEYKTSPSPQERQVSTQCFDVHRSPQVP